MLPEARAVLERYGSIAKRGPEPPRTALVQMVLGMVRNRRSDERGSRCCIAQRCWVHINIESVSSRLTFYRS